MCAITKDVTYLIVSDGERGTDGILEVIMAENFSKSLRLFGQQDLKCLLPSDLLQKLPILVPQEEGGCWFMELDTRPSFVTFL